MNIKEIKNKLWFNIFIRVAVIFIAFVIILMLSNVTLLSNFFISKEKSALKGVLETVSQTDLNEERKLIDTLSEISERYNFDVEIYNSRGSVLYTTHGGQMMDFYWQKNDRFNMSHEEMQVLKSEDLGNGITFQTVIRRFDRNEFLLCKKEIDTGIFAEVRVQKQLVINSASVANEFIIIVSVICLLISVVWIYIFAKKFSKPISEMNSITRKMANLDFSQRLTDTDQTEIGQLSVSVNGLSDSLHNALEDLKEKNRRLRADIEAERQLDSMRKTFIANVSHELKTPISIINGYAEGLKLDINPDEREEYCNTIIEEGNRMNSLVLSILELSKYESGQIQLNLKGVNIRSLTVRLLEKIFKASDLKVSCNIPENTLCTADPLQIEQVLTALLENAKAHTPCDGNISIECEGDDRVKISVFNTGSYIEENQMSQIWQSFYRCDSSHKRDNSRFGLGLSIVAAIMKMHNSQCGVYNTDKGVCFWFELQRFNEN